MRELPDKIVDMTLSGEFVADLPPPPSDSQMPRPPLMTRVMGWVMVLGALSIALGSALLTLWMLAALLPVLIFLVVAGMIAWRVQLWRLRRGRW